MDFRVIRNGLLLFVVAYAETTPLFTVFGIKADIVLVLAVIFAFAARTARECTVLAICASLGLAFGIDIVPSLFFFFTLFFSAYGIQAVLPWQPFLLACVFVLLFGFLSYIPFDWDTAARFAPYFARAALYDGIALVILYPFVSQRHAR